MLTLKGILLNIIDKSEYKKEGETLATPVKAKLQILVESKRANGTLVKDLQTISIPDEKISLYTDKISKEVSVEVGIISKQFSFYGV
jgi:hypothetical protein